MVKGISLLLVAVAPLFAWLQGGVTGLGWGVAAVAALGWLSASRRQRLSDRSAAEGRTLSNLAPTNEQQQLDRWLRLLDAAPVALVEVQRGGVLWANATARQWLALDPQRHAGRPVLWFLPYPSWWEEVRKSRDGMTGAWQRDGEPIVWRLRWLGQSSGSDVDGVLWIEDWTERQRVEAMRRDFVANVSHELRTPLTVLIGALETLSERDFPLDPQLRSDLIAQCERQGQQMLRLVRDLLQLAELEGGAPPAKGWVTVVELIDEACEVGAALAPEGLTVTAELPESLASAELYADATEIASALHNLVSNAVRYTPPPGEITIGATERDGRLVLFVADTGIGIAEEHIPRLTERFYRVDRARSRASGGTGLGLAIVRHIADRHEALLSITSALGKGSRFALEFREGTWRQRAGARGR